MRDSATGSGRKVALTRGMMTRVYDQYPKSPAAPAMATFRAAHSGEMPVHGGGRGPCGGGVMPVLGVLSRNALAAMRDGTEAMDSGGNKETNERLLSPLMFLHRLYCVCSGHTAAYKYNSSKLHWQFRLAAAGPLAQ